MSILQFRGRIHLTRRSTPKVYMFPRKALAAAVLIAFGVGAAAAQTESLGYRKPPNVITDALESPATPSVVLSPARDRMLVLERQRHPSIRDLAQPMLRLAGHRINPATNGPHNPFRVTGIDITTIATRASVKVKVPTDAHVGWPMWSPDGKHFAFTNTTSHTIDLWIVDASAGLSRQIQGVKINEAYGEPIQWLCDSRTLLVQLVPASRGAEPKPPDVPNGPIIQESYGKSAPVRTYEDLLTSEYDEALWDYYATSQLALVDTQTNTVAKVGQTAIISWAESSPDGMHFLVDREVRPYSYVVPSAYFPREVEVWNRSGQLEYKLASLPLSDRVPIGGVPTGPRDYRWRANESATLVWVEALDGGDTRAPGTFRDRIMTLKAPFQNEPTEVVRLEQRFQGQQWFEKGGKALVRDFDRSKRWTRTFEIDFDQPPVDHTCPNVMQVGSNSEEKGCRLIWSRSSQDRYSDPGWPVMRELPTGYRVILQEGDNIYLIGPGASDRGDHPFLDRFDIKTLKRHNIFRCAEKVYEQPVAVLKPDGSEILTLFESPDSPQNLFIRTVDRERPVQLAHFPDPAPELRGITKQLVTYKRKDGVQLSFQLYLPAGYKPGTPLPTILWAYPLEFNDAFTAGQIAGSPYRYTVASGASELWLLTQGYAILDNTSLPVIGDPDVVNNTFVDQIVSGAQSAIDKAVEMGVTDRNRVGVGGHSYGAFMTANLLAHSHLFRAGVAMSGAYNRTLTPFGFQEEQRTFWQARDTYVNMSPFAFADKLRTPILLVHGMADDNSGTFPIQSERMYQALRGNGNNVRYVQLPYEAHGYQAVESVEHVLWEMIAWFDKYVKDGGPPTNTNAMVGGENK